MDKSPYETLGVASSASQDEIKNAYRKLAKRFHPDLNPGSKEAEKHFKEINSAYEMIGTPEQKAKYDRGEFNEAMSEGGPGPGYGGRRKGPFYRETQQGGGRYTYSFGGGGGGVDDDILSSIFGKMGGARGGFEGSVDIPGQDETYEMRIDFREAILGAEREITLPSGKRLRVKIPAGVEDGAKLRFAGQGGPGKGRGSPGDVYLQLRVQPSETFKRSGSDLETELPISLARGGPGR